MGKKATKSMQNERKIHVKDWQIYGKVRHLRSSKIRKMQKRVEKSRSVCYTASKPIHKGFEVMIRILFVCHGRIYRAG